MVCPDEASARRHRDRATWLYPLPWGARREWRTTPREQLWERERLYTRPDREGRP